MLRNYNDGIKDDISFFIGNEVEHTPAYNMKTLFVVGLQDVNKIIELAIQNNCKHIFCGANHSFCPTVEILQNGTSLFDVANNWDKMICELLNKQYMVTLDFDVKDVTTILEMVCNEHNSFIPQISVKIPYIQQLNYNAMLKIDDIDFNKSNPGVWCHILQNLTTRSTFTPWHDYNGDKSIDQ
jgi:hypothetical protein